MATATVLKSFKVNALVLHFTNVLFLVGVVGVHIFKVPDGVAMRYRQDSSEFLLLRQSCDQ